MRMKGENAGRCLAQHLATNCGGGGKEPGSRKVCLGACSVRKKREELEPEGKGTRAEKEQ